MFNSGKYLILRYMNENNQSVNNNRTKNLSRMAASIIGEIMGLSLLILSTFTFIHNNFTMTIALLISGGFLVVKSFP